MRSICRPPQFAPLRTMVRSTVKLFKRMQLYRITQEKIYFGLLNVLSRFPLFRIQYGFRKFQFEGEINFHRSKSRSVSFSLSLIAVAVIHPRFLDVFHLKKLVHVRVLAASGFLETRRHDEFFFSIFNRANDLIGASRLSIEPTCLLLCKSPPLRLQIIIVVAPLPCLSRLRIGSIHLHRTRYTTSFPSLNVF